MSKKETITSKVPLEIKAAGAGFVLSKMNGDSTEDAAQLAALCAAGAWAVKHPFISLAGLIVAAKVTD